MRLVTPLYQGFSQLAWSLASKPWSKKNQNHLFETFGMIDFSNFSPQWSADHSKDLFSNSAIVFEALYHQ
jgi:hypothetical protein